MRKLSSKVGVLRVSAGEVIDGKWSGEVLPHCERLMLASRRVIELV